MHEAVSSAKPRTKGLRQAPAPRFVDATATFNGTYMRPNLDNGGTVPATGAICTSPDIWISGTQPLDPSSLITAASYQASSGNNIAVADTNFIYVRGMNGAATPQTNTVQLYYAPSALIQWPSGWQLNVIPTDLGAPSTDIVNLALGAIGVAQNTFQWSNVQAPPAGSDHYCLFAQLNDAANSNPFPTPGSQVDMAALITNNLGWAWKNTVEVPGNQATFQYQMGFSVDLGQPTGLYNVYVTPKGFHGWSVSFQCSEVDMNGKQIAIPQTLITQDGQLSGVICQLEPGFNSTVTISMFQNGAPAGQPGDSIVVNGSFQTSAAADVDRAIAEGLVDRPLQQYMNVVRPPGIHPTPWVRLGAQQYRIASMPAGGARLRR
jgi:hypothetical protein